MPSIEIVTVTVGGQRFSSWKSVSISAAIKDAARAFRLEAACELGALATFRVFRAGAPVEIYFNGDLVLRGYVDRYQPKIDAKDASVTISGRSKSGDMVDSAAEHPTGRFEKKNIKEIAEALDKFGMGVSIGEGVTLRPIPFYQLTPGETAFRAVERLARSEGLAVMGKADGGIEITSAGKKRHAGGLILGHNVKQAEADHNWSNRHSRYVVKGQRASGSNAESLEIEALVKDEKVDRYRPTVIVVEEDTDTDRAKKRGEARRNRAAGNALKATVTLQGFRDDGGTVWEPNRLVWTDIDFIQIVQDMLVESVMFSQDSGGSITKISLVDPKAYDTSGGKRRGVNKSGAGWGIGEQRAQGRFPTGGQ